MGELAMASGMTKAQAKEEAKWRAESDLRTLKDAEEIRKDPKRLKAAEAVMKKEMDALSALSEKNKRVKSWAK